jgi:glycosyltransferase involved in cell wall biosynthesis
MASTLASNGFEVSILEWDRSIELCSRDKVDNISVYRMKMRAPFGLNLFFMLPIWWVYVFFFLVANSFDIIQPQNFDNLLPSNIISKLRRTKIVYDIADFYADAYVPQKSSFLRKIITLLEQIQASSSNAVLIVDDARQRQVGIGKAPLSVIYNSPPDKLTEFESKAGKSALPNSEFTVFYAGIFSPDRGLDLILSAIDQEESFKLVIAGFGAKEKEFSVLAKNKRNVDFLGKIPYDDVLRLTFLSNCVVALYDPSVPNNVVASPNKLFEAMMCKKPIIVSAGTAMAERVIREKCGLVIDFGSLSKLVKAITLLKNDKDLSILLGLNGRAAYSNKYSWTLMETRLLQLYRSLT